MFGKSSERASGVEGGGGRGGEWGAGPRVASFGSVVNITHMRRDAAAAVHPFCLRLSSKQLSLSSQLNERTTRYIWAFRAFLCYLLVSCFFFKRPWAPGQLSIVNSVFSRTLSYQVWQVQPRTRNLTKLVLPCRFKDPSRLPPHEPMPLTPDRISH